MRDFENGAIAAFASELHESLAQIAAALAAANRHGDRAALREAHRLLHSLKGAAGMVGLPAFAYLLNLTEEHLERGMAETDGVPDHVLMTIGGCLPRLAAYMMRVSDDGTVQAIVPFVTTYAEQLVGAGAVDAATLESLLEVDIRELAVAHAPAPVRQTTIGGDAIADVFGNVPDDAFEVDFDGELAALDAEVLDTLVTTFPDATPEDAILTSIDADVAPLIEGLEPDWPSMFTLDEAAAATVGPFAFEQHDTPIVAEPAAPAELIDLAASLVPSLPTVPLVAVPTELDLAPPDDIAPELADVFAQEAAEHLQTIARVTSSLSSAAVDRTSLQELRRAVHTLKGAAGVVGFKATSKLAHCVEDLLDRLYEGTSTLTPGIVRLLAITSDTLDESINGSADATALRMTIARLIAEFDSLVGSEASHARSEAPQVAALPPVESSPEKTPVQPSPDRRTGADRRSTAQVLRVPVARLDDLVRSVSELVLNRSTLEQHYSTLLAQVEELKFSAARIRKVAQKLETDYEVRALAGNSMSLGSHGFDALEFDRYTDFHLLTRELTETASDVATVSARVSDSIDDFEGDLTRLARLTREIQDRTMEFRMLPLRTLTTRLERTVRVTADACDKQVDFAIEGEDVTLDKSLLEHITDPLLHLLRNAVDHGIETVEARRAAGKSARGRIVVRAFHDGTDVVVEVEDDGKGLDVDRIRRTAIDRGLLTDVDAATLTPEALFDYIFEPGFSTASRVTEISGRGVGMDVVKSAVVRAGGRIQIESKPGAGVTISVRAPMTLAITRVLLVRAGGQTFGLPLGAVVQIVRPHRTAISEVGSDRVLTIDGRAHRLRDLADVLGLPRSSDAPASQPVLIVNLSGRRVALAVDAILHSRDAVVKSLGTHLRRVRGIWGATLLGDGTVVLILNAADLDGVAADPRVRVVSRPVTRAPGPQPYTVLVVDDSLSMRHVLSTTITKAGWHVLQARDGVDALEIVHQCTQPPDAILLDIEMPRMDGYEFLSTIRAHPAHATRPIVMLTSRGSEKHREKAKTLGATDYLVKPFKDDVLIETITRVVQAARESKRVAS